MCQLLFNEWLVTFRNCVGPQRVSSCLLLSTALLAPFTSGLVLNLICDKGQIYCRLVLLINTKELFSFF